MPKTIITDIDSVDSFMKLINNNPGLLIIKLGAPWCKPCKIIEPPVHRFFASSPPEVICADIDVDVSFMFYSFMKNKRLVNGIPALFCYKKGNTTYLPDDSVVGSDLKALDAFFKRCGSIHLFDVKKVVKS